jgi:hypothetical protein
MIVEEPTVRPLFSLILIEGVIGGTAELGERPDGEPSLTHYIVTMKNTTTLGMEISFHLRDSNRWYLDKVSYLL